MTALASDISCPDNAANQKGLRSLDASAGPERHEVAGFAGAATSMVVIPTLYLLANLEGQRGYDRLTAIPARHFA